MKSWFNDTAISVEALQAKTAADKTKVFCRIAYQMPEDGSTHCVRSYEDALILANLDEFGIINDDSAALNAWEKAKNFNKTKEAINYAVREANWNVPKYIKEGLAWLSTQPSLEESSAIVLGDKASAA